MASTDQYDAILIGSGQASGPLSTALAEDGRRTILIEREHVGGTCINEGCTPTKTMVASAEVAYLDRRSGDYGIETGSLAVDMASVRRRKRNVVESFRTNSLEAIEAGGVEVVMGEASFLAPDQVLVKSSGGDVRRLSAGLIVIDTGARPSEPPVPGIAEVPFLNSTTIMELDEVPDHLVIIGGGYVGVEFAQMFRRFGSMVTILQAGDALLAREDPDIAGAVADLLREDGIEVLLNARTSRIESVDGHGVRLNTEVNGREMSIDGSHLLVATGRDPNTGDLKLGNARIDTTERGYVKVNDRLETTQPGVYAVGDVAGSPAFTHISYDDFRVLRSNLIEGGNRTTRDRLVPYTVFMDPQLGRIGLSEQEARNQGRRFKVARMPMSHVARALEVDRARGVMKALVDDDTNQILGCAILGIEGGELMAMVEIAMIGHLPYTALRDGIFAHPTLAEALNNLFSSFEG